MPNTENHGLSYDFGMFSANAPTITGFNARKAELRFEPEVYQEAQDGEGHAEAIALSKATNRMITGTFTGYILSTLGSGGANAPGRSNAIANTFSFSVNGVSRFFIVKSISEPRNKGEYVEVSLEVVSKSLVVS